MLIVTIYVVKNRWEKIYHQNCFSFYKSSGRSIPGLKGYRLFSRKDFDKFFSVGRIIVTE